MVPLNLKCRAKAKNYKNAKVTPGAKVAPVDGTMRFGKKLYGSSQYDDLLQIYK